MNDRELLYALLRTLRDIKQTISSIDKQRRSENSQQQPPHLVEIHSPIQLPVAVHEHYASEQADRPGKNFRENVRLGLECVGLVAAILAAIFTYRTLGQVRKQANAAQAQVGVMKEQLEAANRPWIKLINLKQPDIAFMGPSFRTHFGFKGEKDEVFFNITPVLKNVGGSTAVHVRERVQLVVHKWADGWGNFHSEQKIACDAAIKAKDEATDAVVFPGDPFDAFGQGNGVFLSPENISVAGKIRYVAPAIVGCVDYQFQTSPTHHQTSFAFEVVRADDRSRIIGLGEHMSGARLLLIRDPQYDHAN